MKRKLLYILIFCIYIAAILTLCLMKPDNLPETEMFIFGIPADKVAHFTMFLPFPVLLHMMFMDKSRDKWLDLLVVLAAIVLGIGAAFGTEYLQSMTQYRSSDINDVYADMKGLGIGCIIVLIHIMFRKKESPKTT